MFAVDPKYKGEWKPMIVDEIIHELKQLGEASWVTISGGNPAIHNLEELVRELQHSGWRVNMETQGSIPREWYENLDAITLSPKPPSSGMAKRFNDEKFLKCLDYAPPDAIVKIVVGSTVDYEWAKEVFELVRMHYGGWGDLGFYLSVETKPTDTEMDVIERWRWVADMTLADPTIGDISVIPQCHVLLWKHAIGV